MELLACANVEPSLGTVLSGVPDLLINFAR